MPTSARSSLWIRYYLIQIKHLSACLVPPHPVDIFFDIKAMRVILLTLVTYALRSCETIGWSIIGVRSAPRDYGNSLAGTDYVDIMFLCRPANPIPLCSAGSTSSSPRSGAGETLRRRCINLDAARGGDQCAHPLPRRYGRRRVRTRCRFSFLSAQCGLGSGAPAGNRTDAPAAVMNHAPELSSGAAEHSLYAVSTRRRMR